MPRARAAITNLLLQSDDITAAPWAAFGATPTAGADFDTIDNTGAAPSFTTRIVYQPVEIALAGQTLSFSIEMKAGTTSKATIFINKSSGEERAYTVANLTASAVRYEVKGSFASDSADGNLYIHIAPGDANAGSDEGTIEVRNPQLNLGGFVVYIPTVAATVTRSFGRR